MPLRVTGLICHTPRIRLQNVKVEVVRSPRRGRTADLKPTAEGVRIVIPGAASTEEEERLVKLLLRRHERRKTSRTIDLNERSRRLAREYALPLPQTIRWVSNQN